MPPADGLHPNMNPKSVNRLLFLMILPLAITNLPEVFGADGTTLDPLELAPASPKGSQAGKLSSNAASSVVERLGIKFSSPVKTEGKALVAAQSPEPIFTDTFVLPTFTITDTRLGPTEDNVLTEKARLEIAEKRYITPLYRVTFGPLAQLATYYYSPLSIFMGWHPNEAEAMNRYREDQHVEMLEEMDSLTRLGMVKDAKDVKDAIETKELQRMRYEFIIAPR